MCDSIKMRIVGFRIDGNISQESMASAGKPGQTKGVIVSKC